MFFRTPRPLGAALAGLALCALPSFAQTPSLTIDLPERTRLLQDQRVDLVIEARNVSGPAALTVTAAGRDISAKFTGPTQVTLDCNGTPGLVFRYDMASFQDIGNVRLTATLGSIAATKDIHVRPFSLAAKPRNVILYIGDAMGTAYRDAARLVGKSLERSPGVPALREGYFDDLQEMDKMPVSGMVMTYGSDRVIPDSANTASAWSTGNKTFESALSIFGDGTDCAWRAAGVNAATLASAMDNPRVETLWEYMKRKYNYKTGIVTTAYVTDATPAGEGSHVAQRGYRYEVARQYLESPLFNNAPMFDVIMGGGREEFDSDIRADKRDLVAEFQGKGFKFVSTNTELQTVTAANAKVLGLFRRRSTAGASTGVKSVDDGNMDVAYDKLKLVRPASEPAPNFNGFNDQPMLDTMARKAISVLSGADGSQPFILMVEGASIDKQSHPNHAAGVIWDTLEFDKAIGVGRAFAKSQAQPNTLVLVTADHDQSMSIIGVNEVADADLTDTGTKFNITVNGPTGAQNATIYKDSNANVRASHGYYNDGGDPTTSGVTGPTAFENRPPHTVNGFPNYIDPANTGYPSNTSIGSRGNRRLSVGFRTGEHTGSSVPITAEGPGAFLFTGYMDQTDIPFKIAVSLTGDTTEGDNFVTNVLLNPKYPFTYGKCAGICLF